MGAHIHEVLESVKIYEVTTYHNPTVELWNLTETGVGTGRKDVDIRTLRQLRRKFASRNSARAVLKNKLSALEEYGNYLLVHPVQLHLECFVWLL